MSTTTTTRRAYRPHHNPTEPVVRPSRCSCGQIFADLGELMGHECPDDIRVAGRRPRPDVATTKGDSLDVPEWRGGAKGHTPRDLMATAKQVAYLRKLLADRAALADAFPHPEALTKSEASRIIDAVAKTPADAPAAPAPQATGCRPNRYAGPCRHCGADVPAEAGLLCRQDGRWAVEHKDGGCKPASGHTAAPEATPAPAADVPAGHYAIPSTGDNDLAFYRVDRPAKGAYAGRTFVKLVVGGHPDRNVPRSHVAGILARIAADPDAGPRYGQTIGRCCRCNRHLTDETSRAAGIGPECRRHI